MARAIPISQIVKVLPSVLAAAGNAVDLNGLLLTQSKSVPIGAAQPFADDDDIGDYFGEQSVEVQMGGIYFNGFQNCTKTPGTFYIAQYNEDPVAAWVRGASLATMTVEQLQTVTGSISIMASGTAHQANVDLSHAASFSDAAQTLATDLGLSVTFDPLFQAFVITDSATGAKSTIAAATRDAAVALKLDAGSGATVSQGADAADPNTFMSNIIANVTQNWALFSTTWEPDTADKTAFSKWANSTSDRFAYVGYDSDPQAKVAGSTETWGYAVQSAKMDGTVLLFGDCTHAAFILGFAASLDFNRLNGRATLAFRTQAGLLPSVTGASDALALKANGYNWYGAYANATSQWNFMYRGSISGQWAWLDSYLNQIWLNANLQLAMVQLLMAINSLPYNDQGYSLVDAACMDPIQKAINYGAIRTGIPLSDAEVAEIQNMLGFDASTAIEAKGYYLQIQPATADIRAARASPSMTLLYTDGESIQELDLASVCVV